MTCTEQELEQLRQEISRRESEKRFLHTLGVEKCAASLAQLYIPEKVTEARVAALFHDLTKNIKDEEQITLYRLLGYTDDEPTRSPQVLHGYTAAKIIQREYPKYADEDILSAVLCHTTGKRGMSVLDKIIFLADFIEEGRTYDACREIREDFWSSPDEVRRTEEYLDRYVMRVLRYTIDYLEARNIYVARATRDALEDLENKYRKGDI